MSSISIVFAAIAGLFHVLFFLIESIFWMHPKVHKVFGVTTPELAKQFKINFFNQGFYNLFLAIGVFIGIYLLQGEQAIIGKTLIIFCCASMLAASIVLYISKPGMLIGMLIQGAAPLIAILSWYLGR
ncbi:MAG TPA: DUF1304 domain-containing protein [Chitinophagales bacterium]|jgi:putative membrane protein|nr:DUF1304 domain-containing protein [Chitinophagales bacterium]MBP6153988.1 DUF1304 domain-containing protein [Chitinophagales bacterium]HQV79327.1 DUF1304 domain-containing protein [Chitinophagales bacterium]HQW80219.1 DUF1304 domain-containing protein [Chitinophagales bacterium]HRB69048.1 DUF1304 domain-containing protein [Chitinophagales bacterium]